MLRLRSIDKLTFWVAAILDYKMATTKIVNQSILFPTAKNIDIATKIEFLYCFASEILSKQLLDGVHFAIQDGGPKSFPFKWKHWFLVSERSQLSKNVFGYNSPQKSSESFFLDVATLTILSGHATHTWQPRCCVDFLCCVCCSVLL